MGKNVTGKNVTGKNVTGKNVTGKNVTGKNVTGKNVTGKNVTGKNVTGKNVTGKKVTLEKGTGKICARKQSVSVSQFSFMCHMIRHSSALKSRCCDCFTGHETQLCTIRIDTADMRTLRPGAQDHSSYMRHSNHTHTHTHTHTVHYSSQGRRATKKIWGGGGVGGWAKSSKEIAGGQRQKRQRQSHQSYRERGRPINSSQARSLT